MLRANDIVPRNPEPLEPQESVLDASTPHTSETSSRKGERFKVKNDLEFGSETDDENSIREKALFVRFRFHVVIY